MINTGIGCAFVVMAFFFALGLKVFMSSRPRSPRNVVKKPETSIFEPTKDPKGPSRPQSDHSTKTKDTQTKKTLRKSLTIKAPPRNSLRIAYPNKI
tara:strand:- start:251 stop:538 length:288 start_codon:yes stop_codon:yes gene_type:complete